MKNLVNAKWLCDHLQDENIIIMDCRGNLIDAEEGSKKYKEGHISGAYFIDVKRDLSGPMEKHGGRHPLPDVKTVKEKLESMGVKDNTTIIAYDDNKLFTAARLWWQLKYLGHERVFVLEGGIDKWIENSYSLSRDVPGNREKGNITININKDMVIEAQEIKERLKDEDLIILDARSKKRYLGEVEPVDKIAGHIPGAELYAAKDNLKENGEWKKQEEQEKRFAKVKGYKDIALYCGSGINACLNYIALDELGVQPKLYVGSWSDWVTYEDYPIATRER